jgi:nucleotide-binding universal stress UspA family protein
MTHLLVPIDERETSHRAVPVAGRLAKRLELPIQLFTRVETDAEAAAAGTELDRIAATYLGDNDVTTATIFGEDPVESIVSAAGETGIVCMGTAASVRFHDGHFGSVAEGVTRTVGRPLVLVGPEMERHPGTPTQKVVVPVDGSELSEAGIEVGGRLAKKFDVPLWLVTVVSPKQEAAALSELGPSVVAGESNYVHNLARDIRKAHTIDAEYEVLHHDHPAEAIVDFVGDDGTCVMTTHGRSGLGRLVAGSVATGVVAHSKRAVVVYRPPGIVE